VGYYSYAKDVLQIVSLVILVSIYLKLACCNVIVHKTLPVISWCHSVSVFLRVILHQNLFLQAKQCYNKAVFPLGAQF